MREQQRDQPKPELLAESASCAPVSCAHGPQPRAVRFCKQLALVALLVHVVPHLPAEAPVMQGNRAKASCLLAY